MTDFLHPRWSLMLGAITLALLIIIAVFQLAGMRQTFVLASGSIQHDAGCAYVIALKNRPYGWPATRFVSDTTPEVQSSRLILLEDGMSFGQPHALQNDIRRKGGGLYSHWEQSLYFSALDCSDPRENGKRYEASIPLTLSEWIKASWFIAAFALSFWVMRRFPDNKAIYFTQKLLDVLLSRLDFIQRPLRAGIFLALLLASAGFFFVWVWGSGKSVNLAIGGAYQVSDAAAYWTCANALLDFGHSGNAASSISEWCQRRAIYPTLLSGFAWIAQRNIFSTLLLQALIVCFGIFVVMRRSCSYVGAVGVAVGTVLLLRYATTDLFVLTMTENAGVLFGCLGLASLLKSSENRSLAWVVAGIAMLSIALNARAGAFLILPFLVLWAGVAARLFKKNIWQWIVASSMATVVGFALQAALVVAVGGSPGSSHGNFSYVLYGLSAGGMGWQQVLVDHPELSGSDAVLSKAIYALAWKNITLHPELFFQGLYKNLSLFVSVGTYGYEKLGMWAALARLCWWLAWIPLLSNAKKPAYLLISLASLGIFFSSPFLLGNGGSRVFAATVAVDVIQISLGIFWIISVLKSKSTGSLLAALTIRVAEPSPTSKSFLSIEVGLAMFVLVMLMVPHGLSSSSTPQKYSSDTVCNPDEYKVITYIGDNSTMLLSIVDNKQKADVLRGEITKRNFVEGISPSAWYRDQTIAFKGASLLAAYQFDQSDTAAPGPYMATSDINLSREYYGRLVRLCIDKNKKEIIFDTPYRKLNSITVLD